MARFITVGAAQMGPVGRSESRSAVVVRLLEMLREAKGRGCDLVVFTECALTPFFPRFWEEEASECDRWFDRETPGTGTSILFNEAKKLGIGFHLGYAELAEESGRPRHYNTSILVGPDGQIIGKYRKIHLPGPTTKDGENPHRSYEKRYFDRGNLGFRAWQAFGGVIGLCLGNDRRWPETYRTLALQGAELILIGYNTVADHPEHPELDHLTNFHSMLAMQAGAYQNGCFVVGVAKAGNQEGLPQIGRSAIIAPSGEVVTQCTSLGDELVVHRCNLDQAEFYKNKIFHFADRQIEAYSLITQTRTAIPPFEPGQDLDTPLDFRSDELSTEKNSDPTPNPIETLFTEQYGYPPDQARQLAEQAQLASRQTEESPPERTVPERPADPLTAIREVLKEDYNYSAAQIDPIIEQAARALSLARSAETDTAEEPKSVQPPAVSEKTLTLLAPETQVGPTIGDVKAEQIPAEIGWRPGRFEKKSTGTERDHLTQIVDRLVMDYGYPEDLARQIAGFAEAAWLHRHPPEKPASSELPATSVYIPEEHPAADAGKPLTQHFSKSPIENTSPALSSEEAFHVFSVLTEKFGYSAKSAKSIAERASSASRRWQNVQAEEQTKVPASPAEPALPVAAKTVVGETPAELAPAVLQKAEASQSSPEAESAPEPIVVVPCPECQFPLKIIQSSLLGRKARCPQCQTKFRLPESA